MDRKTLLSLERACHIRLTEEEVDIFLLELQEIEDGFPDLPDEGMPLGAAEILYSMLRKDEPLTSSVTDLAGYRDDNGYYIVQGDGHE